MRPRLWLLNLSVPANVAELVGEALESDAAAVTVVSPPRCEVAEIEAIYQQKPDKAAIAIKLSVLMAAMGLDVPEFTVKPAPNLDWLKKVASDFPPIAIGRWTVHGAMHRDKVPDREFALQIDATSAFGTGEHPTTRGCLLLLDELLQQGFAVRRMADIGCGSGILAMACAQATKCKAVGVDIDKASVRIAKDNAIANGLDKNAKFACGDGYRSYLVRRAAPYDLIMSNIFAAPLCEMAGDLKENLAPKGMAILSGLLTAQAEMVISAHEKQGLKLVHHKKLGEWSALALKHNDVAG